MSTTVCTVDLVSEGVLPDNGQICRWAKKMSKSSWLSLGLKPTLFRVNYFLYRGLLACFSLLQR